jgi:hypothetical protein
VRWPADVGGVRTYCVGWNGAESLDGFVDGVLGIVLGMEI